MGAPILHAFLIGQQQAWKDKYIESIISLSGAWGGSMKPVKVYAIGDNLGSRLLSASILRPLQISFPSLAFLMPSQELWGSDEVIITTPEKNYTLNDIEDYFM
ncbi:unnamed protein product [Rotaria magnacalcarata]|nr:unnamed protein product [Rotaria magnacalcarata]